MSLEFRISTIDNPFNPFDEFEDWFSFDSRMNYNSSQLVARFLNSSTELSEKDQNLDMERAIDEVIKESPLNIFIKVSKDRGGPDRST